jgi:hypothetical protein
LVDALERQIDAKYFNTDDVCVGDANYQSMSTTEVRVFNWLLFVPVSGAGQPDCTAGKGAARDI